MWPWDRGEWARGAVGIGTWAVLSSIPEGACACGAEGHMASIGPLALGAKGCVERLRPTGETTHYDLCVAGAPANHVRCASLHSRGRRLAVRITIECHIPAQTRTPFASSRHFPSRGNERCGKKNRASYTSCTIPVHPTLVAGATTFPPQFGGAAKGKRLNGQARRLTSPHLEVLCRTSTGDYKAPLCCERLMKRMLRGVLFCPLNRGKSGAAG